MIIETRRFFLRDFVEADRTAFLRYQADPRYRALYGIAEGDDRPARELFDRFLRWRHETPRRRFQLGIFARHDDRLCGCAGLRLRDGNGNEAVLGIELAPDDWGRYRLALEVAAALAEFGFGVLRLDRIIGDTASGNRRVERLARWFGAEIVASRPGPGWMTARGWSEVDWALSRETWMSAAHGRHRRTPRG
jgi:[ribosomal protein S5]-alanine N-acetyltransferase